MTVPVSESADYAHACVEYLRHQKGAALLWAWLARWEQVDGWFYDQDRQAILLSETLSTKFLFGMPKPGRRHQSGHLFLGCQRQEREWLTRLPLRMAVWDVWGESAPPRPQDVRQGLESAARLERRQQLTSGASVAAPRLWLIFDRRPTPDRAWEDLPPFVLGLRVDAEQLEGWSARRLDFRGIWWDELDQIHVDRSPFATCKVARGALVEHWKPSEITGVRPLADVIAERARARLEARGLDHNPGFQGDRPLLSGEQQKLVDPETFDQPFIVETGYQGLFGQFIEGNVAGPRQRPGQVSGQNREK